MLNSKFQSSYKASHSCETLLLKLVNDILWNMESKEITNLVMCDLSGAFDSVDHSILLQLLKDKFGVFGSALCWFESYLHQRSFKVCVNNQYSETNNDSAQSHKAA